MTRWAYSDRERLVDNVDGTQSHDPEAVKKLVSSKPTAGNATFKVMKDLFWPPRIETRMCLCASSSSSPPSDTALANVSSTTTLLEVSVINTGPDSVSVQTRGHQRILIPWGLFHPEPNANDDRIRIIDTKPLKPPTSSLEVINSATTMEVLRGNQRRGTRMLTNRQPRLEHVITLKPGALFVRKIDIGELVGRLRDGQYQIRMQSRGCRWWAGEVGKAKDEERRVPTHLCETIDNPPLMLESLDEVELRIRDGKVI